MKRKIICFVIAAVFIVGAFPLSIIAQTMRSYTYTYNEWGTPIPSPDAYRVTEFILGQHLYFNGENIGQWHTPQDLHVWRDRAAEDDTYLLYVVDSGNNRIVVLEFYGANHSNFRVINVVTEVRYYQQGDRPGSPSGRTTFNNPHGIFVSDWDLNRGERWIADTSNQRILHVDADWVIITEIKHPANYVYDPETSEFLYRPGQGDSQIPHDSDFLPSKLVVDFSGRIFVQARGVNRGLMEFDRNGAFAGYMGAPPVVIGMWDQFWRLIATQEMRERMMLAVPVEYNNVSIDEEGFLFVTTGSPDVEPVARLNAMGSDIMIRNWVVNWTEVHPTGDMWYGTGAAISGPSVFIDVTALPNGVFVTFDRNRGRLFAYDTQGQLLYAWGGPGNRQGFFENPAALDNMGYTLFALDAGIGPNFAAITRFDLTEYGEAINRALYWYNRGDYDRSYYYWTDVIRMNGNFGLAYIGLARALLRQGGEQDDMRAAMEYYRRAMNYFRLQNDQRNFGRAFGFYRRIWVEQNFPVFVVALVVLIIIPPVVKKIIKVRREIKES